MNYLDYYMQIILDISLQLTEGESLSINTAPSHYKFAQDLAQKACERTLLAVSIVVITDGKPSDVLTISPTEHIESKTPPIRSVLLRIDDTEDRNWAIDEEPLTISQDMALLQSCGNLAPPQLAKMVAPWAIISVPGPVWAKHFFGSESQEQDLITWFSHVLKLSEENPLQAWHGELSRLDKRLYKLNAYDFQSLHISDSHTNLWLDFANQSRWRGAKEFVPDKRVCVPYLPPLRCSMLPQRNSLSGTCSASEPFYLLGKKISGAQFTFSQGKVIEYWAKEGKEVLDIAFSIDEGARYIGEISLTDGFSLPSQMVTHNTGFIGFDENRISTITFGMGEASHVEALDVYEDHLQLQTETGCNVSDLRFRVPIGSSTLTVMGKTFSEEHIKIVENGLFCL